MCGIIAYLGHVSKNKDQLFRILYQGLSMIQNRGYDSVGLGSIRDQSLIIRKYANQTDLSAYQLIKSCENDFDGCYLGIGHSRWATHGAKTDQNAHPHSDYYQRFAVVHNGIIENYQELKNKLIEKGYLFKSETDTEVIANLISFCYEKSNDVDLAIENAINQLQGTWALAIITTLKPKNLYLCKNGSPLLLGFNEHEMMAVSEVAGFNTGMGLITQYIILKNHDIISLNIDENFNFKHSSYKIHALDKIKFDTTPDPYPYWMVKEIEEQPQSLMRVLNFGGRFQSDTEVKLGGLEKSSERLLKIENLLILGCGTSLYAGYYGAQWFKKLGCFNTITMLDASEFTLDDLPQKNAGVIVISQSGETKDVHRSMELIKQTDTPIIGVVNAVDSLISRECDCGVYLNAGREVSVASTKSFTSQSIALVLIAIWFAQKKSLNERKRQLLVKSLHSLSHTCTKILTHISDFCQKIAKYLKPKQHCFILGREILHPIALESALKLKEIGYIHAEGFCGGSLKHGPFALINADTPVFILSSKETRKKMESTIEEIRSRNAPVIVISNHENTYKELENQINIDIDNQFDTLLYVLVFQLIAYHLSVLKGHDPDHPKNLAKVVTVDG